MSSFFASAIIVGIGIGFIALYVSVARKRWGVKTDFVQAILYKIDSSSLSGKEYALLLFLRFLKFFGILAVIIGIFSFFTEK